MPKKKNTVAKVGKDVVTFSDSGGTGGSLHPNRA